MKKTILTIEDDSFLVDLEAKKLESIGYKALVALNSKEAYEAINKHADEINLVLIDLLLPEVDGFAILEHIKEEGLLKGIPIIVFSNLYEKEDIRRAKSLGAQEFFVKANFSLDELMNKVKELTQ